MREPLFSIVVPVYNAAHVLPWSVPAVLGSGADRWCFVDDGSSDGSGQLLRALTAQEPRAQVIEFGVNRGRSEARNAGVAATAGPSRPGPSARGAGGDDVVVFFDADVAPSPQTARALAEASGKEGVVAAVGGLEPAGLDPTDPYHRYLTRYPRGPQGPAGAPVSWRYFVTASAAVRRGALERAGGFDPSVAYAQDLALALRLRAAHPHGLAWVPHPAGLVADMGRLADRRAKLTHFGTHELAALEAITPDALSVLGLERLKRHDPVSRATRSLVSSRIVASAVERALPRLPDRLVPFAVRYLLGHTVAVAYGASRS